MSATRELMFDRGQPSYSEVNTDVINALTTTTWRYWVTLGISAATALLFFVAPWIYQIIVGVGAAGMNRNAMWGTYLSNFIFWIGLSHSGTLLSAVLHITQSDWRKSIYRSAEAMTLFSLMTAAMFVMVHVGRVWFVHWTFPIPNPMELWPNFRSPLMFDVMAILTYLTASSVFIYMGSLPDFAAVRDRSTGLRRKVYAVMCFGWRGTAHEWHTLGWAYTFFAVLVIPLAVSVHSIVSWDFAMSTVPGLHHTIFAPYFVCGAIYSGTAGIVTVMWMLRKFMGFGRYIGQLHIDNLSKLLAGAFADLDVHQHLRELQRLVQRLLIRARSGLVQDLGRPVLVAVLGDDPVLRRRSAGAVLAPHPDQLERDAGDLHPDQHRHADGALRHRRQFAAAQVPARRVRDLLPEPGRDFHHGRLVSRSSRRCSCCS